MDTEDTDSEPAEQPSDNRPSALKTFIVLVSLSLAILYLVFEGGFGRLVELLIFAVLVDFYRSLFGIDEVLEEIAR